MFERAPRSQAGTTQCQDRPLSLAKAVDEFVTQTARQSHQKVQESKTSNSDEQLGCRLLQNALIELVGGWSKAIVLLQQRHGLSM